MLTPQRGLAGWRRAKLRHAAGCLPVALAPARDFLLRAKHLVLLPWWLAARSPAKALGAPLVGFWAHSTANASLLLPKGSRGEAGGEESSIPSDDLGTLATDDC